MLQFALFLNSISSSVILVVSNRNFLKKKNPIKVIIEKKAKLYPIPFPPSNAPTTTGNKKVIEPLTTQLENDPMATPLERILFGKISANKTNTTAPNIPTMKNDSSPEKKILNTSLPGN